MRVETPCVVEVGSVYHMYYSGFSEQSAIQGNSQIGHATSLDGVRWTKDLRNPVVTGQSDNQFAWGYGGVGEPGIMYNPNDQLFYLYYTGMRYSPVNSTIGQMGILLAKSSDGSRFEHVTAANGERQAILFRDVPSAINGAWFGYSTPSPAMTSTGEVHLFATFFVGPGGPSTTQGVGIDHAVSPNGVDFAVVEQNILTAGQGDWKNNNVRAPSVIEHGGNLMMWYAGDRTDPYGSGIGFASRPFPY